MDRTITVNGCNVQVHVEVNQRARKTVTVEVRSRDRIRVRVPKGREVDVDVLLEKYRPQIERKHRSYLSLKHVYEDGSILYEGKPHRIQVTKSDCNRVDLQNNTIMVKHRGDYDPDRLLKSWLTERTRERVEQVIEEHPGLQKPLRATVTDTKRWGYTRKGGVIVLNWQLSTLPKELAEYVIIHELIHLEHANHLNGFYFKLTQILPDYKKRAEKISLYKPI